ncbi:MAG: hypothetical protein ACOYL3_16390 [Desulfuromonadaceae bacterium]
MNTNRCINNATAPHLPTPAQAVAALRDCLDSLKVRRFLFGHLHGGRAACPACGVEIADGRAVASFWEGRRVACKGCRHYFTATTSTPFCKSKLSDEQIFLLLVSIGFDLDNRRAAAVIGVNASSIRENRQKIETLQKKEITP